MLSVILLALSGAEHKLDLVYLSQQTLHSPSADLATVVLHFQGHALSHCGVKGLSPVGLAILKLSQGVHILQYWFLFIVLIVQV